MVVISPVKIWNNGVEATATLFNLSCVMDNLSNAATFFYQMLSDPNTVLTQGNINMMGADYEGWQTNEYAYNWAAQQLNLTILHDYTTTTTTTTSSTTTTTTNLTTTTTSSTTTQSPSTSTTSSTTTLSTSTTSSTTTTP